MLEAIHPSKTNLITADEFWTFLETVEDETRRFELIEGVIEEMSPASMEHGRLSGRILGKIFVYLESNPIGLPFGDGVGYQLKEYNILMPDMSFISKSRLITPLPKVYPIAPDLAVEVISPSNTYREIRSKIEAYLAHGTQLVWAVYPEDKVVDVWRAMPDGSLNKRTFTINDTLSGEGILPDFTLPISQIFS
ncbi:MAG: Uma2 family endonuclease [bacterium]|nr:Uma2 family endonuclease [bacterium]